MKHAYLSINISLGLASLFSFLHVSNVMLSYLPNIFYLDNKAFEISIGLALSVITAVSVYFLTSLFPKYMENRKLKLLTVDSYKSLKRELVITYLSLIGYSWDDELLSSLESPVEFSDFFAERYRDSQSRWHAVHNGLYEYGMPKIKSNLSHFSNELELLMIKVDVPHSKSLERLRNVRMLISDLSHLESEYDDIKLLLNRLHQFHCPWSLLDGEIKDDLVETAIMKI